MSRLVSNGPLNSPWGLAVAPAGFGAVSGDLLVGNFGDGAINAFTPGGVFAGTLADLQGHALVNDGLWSLAFGNGGSGGKAGTLYLTAGPNGETNGLFASITAVPEPGSLVLVAAGLMAVVVRRRLSALK